MPSAAGQGALPGMSLAEAAIARARAIYAQYLAPKAPPAAIPNPFYFLWDCSFNERDRRFLCRLAGVDPSCAELVAHELPIGVAMRLTWKMTRLLHWAGQHRAALDAWRCSEFGERAP